MRNTFAREILSLAEQDDRVVLLMGDIGNRLFEPFKERFPNRFFNCGIAEANMISMAAGMAAEGLRPFCYTIAPFATYRCYEQIRVDVCYHDVPVVIVGTGAGLSYAQLGATHHSCEDIAVMRVLPEMQVMTPADTMELESCMGHSLASGKPSYIRIGKKGEPVIHSDVPQLEFGKAFPLLQGDRIAVLSAGTLLSVGVEAAESLRADGHSVELASFPFVKPLDVEYLEALSCRVDLFVTLEEHSTIGGFGSAVAEWLVSKSGRRPPLLSVGTGEGFVHETSTQASARELLGLTPDAIKVRILDTLKEL